MDPGSSPLLSLGLFTIHLEKWKCELFGYEIILDSRADQTAEAQRLSLRVCASARLASTRRTGTRRAGKWLACWPSDCCRTRGQLSRISVCSFHVIHCHKLFLNPQQTGLVARSSCQEPCQCHAAAVFSVTVPVSRGRANFPRSVRLSEGHSLEVWTRIRRFARFATRAKAP